MFHFCLGFPFLLGLHCFPAQIVVSAQNDTNCFVVWKARFTLPSGILIFDNLYLKDSLISITARQKDKTLLLQTNLNFDTLSQLASKDARLEDEIWSGLVQQTFVRVLHRNSFGNQDKLVLRISQPDTTYELTAFNSDPVRPAHIFVKSRKNELFIALQPTARHYHDSAKILFWFISIPEMKIAHSEIVLAYEERLTEAIDVFQSQGQIKMLHKVYNISPIEKRQFQPNYTFDITTFDPLSKDISVQKLPFRPGTYYLRARCFTNEKIIATTYGNLTHNKALGYYLYSYDTGDSVHLPFNSSVIKESRLTRFEKPRTIAALHPDLLWKDNQGNLWLVGEQYYNKRVGSSGRETIYSFHYGAVVISKYGPDFKLLEQSVIRKKQRSYNDMGQQLSYNIVFRKGEPVVVFNHHKKHLRTSFRLFNNGRKPAQFISAQNQKGVWVQSRIPQTGAEDLAILPQLITRISVDQYLVMAARKRNLYIGYLYLTKQP